MTTSSIQIQNISYHTAPTSIVFDDLSASFEHRRYGVVGDNGTGKSTLLRLIAAELKPQSGSIVVQGSSYYLPQSYNEIAGGASIADVLGVAEILSALRRLQAGGLNEHDFALAADHWDLEQRIAAVLLELAMWPLDLTMACAALSGGQKTKLLLARSVLFPADFLLFDEPTNNLDHASRQWLYQYIVSNKSGMIVVSHDRALLNLMDVIVNINAHGLTFYGGNYDFFVDQQAVQEQALERQYAHAERQLKQAETTIQRSREKHEKLAARGKKAFRQGKVDKLTALSKKGRSENTHKRMTTQSLHSRESKRAELDSIKQKRIVSSDFDFTLPSTHVSQGKRVLLIEDLLFQYPHSKQKLFERFNLIITGPERTAIVGNNGCGKSTLLQLLLNRLQPLSGVISVAVDKVAYLDQQVSMLHPSATLVDEFLRLNPKSSQFDAYSKLARFDFKNQLAEKKVSDLSGGERMRAGLAICLMSSQPPQLILLDEPTNHLDLRSIAAIENMLNCYQGAIIAVSHDMCFLKNIGVERRLEL